MVSFETQHRSSVDLSRGPPREELPLPTKPPYTAFVGNLSFETSEGDLSDFFSSLTVRYHLAYILLTFRLYPTSSLATLRASPRALATSSSAPWTTSSLHLTCPVDRFLVVPSASVLLSLVSRHHQLEVLTISFLSLGRLRWSLYGRGSLSMAPYWPSSSSCCLCFFPSRSLVRQPARGAG